jgi:hypothetical protein
MSAADYQTARLATQGTSGVGGDAAAAFFAQHGLTDPDALERVRARRNHFSSLVPGLPPRYRRLMDGQVLRIGGHDWTCIAGHGHAPEHISLHAPALGVLISGDMVLPRISTNVSVGDTEPEADPLALYLASIERMRHCRPTRGCCRRTGGPSSGCTRASASCSSTTTNAWPTRWPPAAPRPAARPNCCRCCSSAAWTCTRPRSQWAKQSLTCTRWPAAAGGAELVRDGYVLGGDGVRRFSAP